MEMHFRVDAVVDALTPPFFLLLSLFGLFLFYFCFFVYSMTQLFFDGGKKIKIVILEKKK